MHPKHRSNGFSLMEAAISLCIIGVVLGGIWAASQYVSRSMHVSDAKRQITAIVTNIRQLYAAKPTFVQAAGVSITNDMERANIFPNDLRPDLSGTTNPMLSAVGGEVCVRVGGNPAGTRNNNRHFTVGFGNDGNGCGANATPIDAPETCVALAAITTGTAILTGLTDFSTTALGWSATPANLIPTGFDSCTGLTWTFSLK